MGNEAASFRSGRTSMTHEVAGFPASEVFDQAKSDKLCADPVPLTGFFRNARSFVLRVIPSTILNPVKFPPFFGQVVKL
jgi:hypothetical protein